MLRGRTTRDKWKVWNNERDFQTRSRRRLYKWKLGRRRPTNGENAMRKTKKHRDLVWETGKLGRSACYFVQVILNGTYM